MFFILLIIGGFLEFLISSVSSVMIIFKSVSSSRRISKFLQRNKVFDISILKGDKADDPYERRRSADEIVAEGFTTVNGDVYIHGIYVGIELNGCVSVSQKYLCLIVRAYRM